MIGVLLCGGRGTRLSIVTSVVNKHCLPVYNKPMLYWPMKNLFEAGCSKIVVVVGGDHRATTAYIAQKCFDDLLADKQRGGAGFGSCCLDYVEQFDEPSGVTGIAHALLAVEPHSHFGQRGPLFVALGDNITNFSFNISKGDCAGAMVFLHKLHNREECKKFGIAEFVEDKLGEEYLAGIIEKPEDPPSDYAVTGFYVFPFDVFDVIKGLEPSGRNELEITDVNNWYIKNSNMDYEFMDDCFWTDAGTFPSLFKASFLMAHQYKGAIDGELWYDMVDERKITD